MTKFNERTAANMPVLYAHLSAIYCLLRIAPASR
jgi:hypothetical protein